MTTFKLKGSIKHIGEIEQITGKFRKKDIVVSPENERYEQKISLSLLQDNCTMADGLVIGDIIECDFIIQGKEAKNGKYYNNLVCTSITYISGPVEEVEEQTFTEATSMENSAPKPDLGIIDDLPFIWIGLVALGSMFI